MPRTPEETSFRSVRSLDSEVVKILNVKSAHRILSKNAQGEMSSKPDQIAWAQKVMVKLIEGMEKENAEKDKS